MPIPFVFFVFLWWFPFLVLSVVLMFFERTRNVGLYILLVPTGALLLAFPLTQAVFYIARRTLPHSHLESCYLCTFVSAALSGAVVTLIILKKVVLKTNPAER